MFSRTILSLGLLLAASACTPITTSTTAVDANNAPSVRTYDRNLEPGSQEGDLRSAVERQLGVDRSVQQGGMRLSTDSVGFDVPETAPPPRSCTKC